MTKTSIGRVTLWEGGARVQGSRAEMSRWADGEGGHGLWPCSALRQLRFIDAHFDARGDLVGLYGDNDDVSGDELTAWSSDVLRAAGFGDHLAVRS